MHKNVNRSIAHNSGFEGNSRRKSHFLDLSRQLLPVSWVEPEVFNAAAIAQPRDAAVRHIYLGHGEVAIVDATDYPYLIQFHWRFQKSVRSRSPYAKRYVGVDCDVAMHNTIMNPPDGYVVDHKNGNGLDNRRSNLRICTHKENSRNRRVILSASGFKGVTAREGAKRSYSAQIGVNMRLINLGSFASAEEAAAAYDAAAIKHFGEFAATNAELRPPV